jgi:hypothetical protein
MQDVLRLIGGMAETTQNPARILGAVIVMTSSAEDLYYVSPASRIWRDQTGEDQS